MGLIYSLRMTQFTIMGFRQFMKEGYERHAAKFDATDMTTDMKGKTAMITGANQGIGLITTMELAKRGATVHMVCRNEARGEAARRSVVEQTGNENVHLLVADMSVASDVRQLAERYTSTGAPLHVLVNNAGQLVNPRTVGADGNEVNFATNTLAPFLLTSLLLPVLRRSQPSRVVTVASAGAYTEHLETQDMQWAGSGFTGAKQYARDKRRQLAYTEWFAQQAGDAGVGFYTMHPGWADTDAVRASLPEFYEALKSKLRSPEQGADTVAWLCLVDQRKLRSGGFYFDRKEAPKHLGMAWTDYSAEAREELVKALCAVGGLPPPAAEAATASAEQKK